MLMENITVVKYFNICGLQETWMNKSLYFALTLVTYLFIITLNLTLIVTIIMEKSLHEPMYAFLCNLCMNSLFGTAGFYPVFLHELFSGIRVISHGACFSQAYVIHTFAACEITILSVMAFDRFLAICRPLYYHVVMTPVNVVGLIVVAWLYPLVLTMVSLGLIFRLPLCGSNIYNLFCDIPSIIRHSCVPITINIAWGNFPFIVQVLLVSSIVFSYCQITKVCLNSADGRMKFTQTCVPHLIAMVLFIITFLFNILCDERTVPQYMRNAIAVQFLVIPPISNPVIYGLNLKIIRRLLFSKCRRNLILFDV